MIAPLEGMTVIEARSSECSVSVALALSFCTRIAASLGAQVYGCSWSEKMRYGPTSSLSAFLGAGKATCDATEIGKMRQDATSPIALVADRAFIDASALDTRPSILVSLSDTAFESDARSSEFTLMARSGILDLIGDPAKSPLPLPGHQPAYAAGLAAYTGMAAAMIRTAGMLDSQERVDVNILDTLLWLNWKSVLSAAWKRPSPRRQGRIGEWPMLRCADGWMALVFRDVEWPALKKLVGDPRLDNSCFETRASREANRTTLFDIVEEMFCRHTRAELTTAALALRVPLGPVLAPHELREDSQYQARNVFEPVQVEGGDLWLLPKLPVNWITPQSIASKAPEIVA